jgi:hypothetical protein
VTADQFNATLEQIGWSRRGLAERLGMNSDRAVRRWSNSQNAIPEAVAAWMREVARTLRNLPPPVDGNRYDNLATDSQ